MKTNKYGHIIEGEMSIKELWKARGIVVSAINGLSLLLIVKEDSQEKKGLQTILNGLERGLKRINKRLGIPLK